MFDNRSYYKLFNSRMDSQYQKEKEQIRWIVEELKVHKGPKEARLRYVKAVASYLLKIIQWEEKWDPEYYLETSGEQLENDQRALFEDIMPGRYERSIWSPSFASKVLGAEEGRLLSAAAAEMQENRVYAFRHMRFAMHWNHVLFLELFQLLNQERRIRASEIREVVDAVHTRFAGDRQRVRVHLTYDFQDATLKELIETLDWSDPLNLYVMGEYVSEQAKERQQDMASRSEEEVDALAQDLVQDFRRGFFRGGKDILSKKVVSLIYPLGYERLIQKLCQNVRQEIRYIPHIEKVCTEPAGPQFITDHANDRKLFFYEPAAEEGSAGLAAELEENAEMLDALGGRIVVLAEGPEAPAAEAAEEPLLSSEEEQTFAAAEQKTVQLLKEAIRENTQSYAEITIHKE